MVKNIKSVQPFSELRLLLNASNFECVEGSPEGSGQLPILPKSFPALSAEDPSLRLCYT